MPDNKKKNTKLRALFSALLFSIVLMIFPVTSGMIVAIRDLNPLKTYWIQGIFMMLSITVPALFMLITNMRLSQIGFTGIKKGSFKTILYFVPLMAAKAGFLFEGINNDVPVILALIFFTVTIGLSEEIYFRRIILHKLISCFSLKQTVIISAAFFAVIHASQAFSGIGTVMTALTIINAFLFGIIASEIVLLTKSIVLVIIWHTIYDFVNWISLVNGITEVIIILVQTLIMIIYAVYLWSKLSDRKSTI